MPRINIEDQFWRDISRVIEKTGNRDIAIGQAIRFLDLAQTRFKNNRVITEAEFLSEGFTDGLIGVFAERVEGGFMAIGAEKNFKWLRDRVQAGRKGGEKSGESRRSDSNELSRSKPKQVKPKSSNPNPLPLSLPLSLSLAHAHTLSEEGEQGSQRRRTAALVPAIPTNPSISTQVWNAYSEEYSRRYRVAPTRNAKVNGQIAQFVKRVPAEEAVSIVRFYVRHPKTFYVQKLHEFGLCLADAEALRTQFLAGGAVTDGMIKEYRATASETRTKGIAEIIKDRESQKNLNGGQDESV